MFSMQILAVLDSPDLTVGLGDAAAAGDPAGADVGVGASMFSILGSGAGSGCASGFTAGGSVEACVLATGSGGGADIANRSYIQVR